jgi:hypothetical protein
MTILTVVYVADTNNILAAVTRTAAPASEPDVRDLVGDGLLVRSIGDVDITVEADRLKVAVVDGDPLALENPRGFLVKQNSTPTLIPVPSGSSSTVTITLQATSARVQTTQTGTGLKVLLVIEKVGGSAPAPLVRTGELAGSTITFNVTLDPGPWQAVAFVTNQLPAGQKTTIP